MLRLLHAAGVPVQAFTVNEPEDVERLLDWGVDTIITDQPAMAVSAVRAWLAAPPGTPALERLIR
jgi:glycerophosphoryl diester phosphodiesterase